TGGTNGLVPLKGPQESDAAVTDFVNRTLRIVRYSPREVTAISSIVQQLADAAQKSFSYLNLSDPRNLVFPAQLALSASRLATQSALRGLVTFEVLGPARVEALFRDFFEMFTEFQVFVGLEYHSVIQHCQKRLEAAPDDHGSRLELGKTLVKCGL